MRDLSSEVGLVPFGKDVWIYSFQYLLLPLFYTG